jgi:hypothetical protein
MGWVADLFLFAVFPVLIAMPWVASSIVFLGARRYADASLDSKRSHSFLCSLMFGISSLIWLVLDMTQGLPYIVLWEELFFVLPALAATLYLWFIMWEAVVRHVNDLVLWMLAISGTAYPFVTWISLFSAGGAHLDAWYAAYGFFAVTSSIWWFRAGKGQQIVK